MGYANPNVEVRFVQRLESEVEHYTDPGLKCLHNTFLRAEVKIHKTATKDLDKQFIHPELWEPIRRMRPDRQAKVKNDCYQFAVLAWWLLSSADPFGEGVPEDPSHDRIYRMQNNHYYWNTESKVLILTQRCLFLQVARGRWGKVFQREIVQNLKFNTLILLTVEQLKLIRDLGFRCRYRKAKTDEGGCTLYMHPNITKCPHCGRKFITDKLNQA